MELLMKLKCSSTPAHSSHTLKAVHRLQQQQQQQQQQKQQQQQQRLSCMEYSVAPSATPTIDCCVAVEYMNMQARCCNNTNYCAAPLPACCGGGKGLGGGMDTYTSPMTSIQVTQQYTNAALLHVEGGEEGTYEYKEPEENFVSIDDVKIKGFLMKIGQEQRAKQEEQVELQKRQEQQKEKQQKQQWQEQRKIKPTVNQGEPLIVYEIIDLDNDEEREKLNRIKNQADFAAIAQKKLKHAVNQQNRENKDKLQETTEASPIRHSPNISLVPAMQKRRQSKKQNNNEPLRIIAEIELLDSSDEEAETQLSEDDEPTQDEGNQVLQVMSDEEGNDALVPAMMNEKLVMDCVSQEVEEEEEEYVDLPLAAVSCELKCEDDVDDYNQNDEQNNNTIDNSNIVVLGSDEEFIDENEEGLEVRWEELELGQRCTRNNFECFVCGKKVQSNYNLRRHMMIHTGESYVPIMHFFPKFIYGSNQTKTLVQVNCKLQIADLKVLFLNSFDEFQLSKTEFVDTSYLYTVKSR